MLKKLLRVLALFVVPFTASFIIRFLYFTNRKVFYAPQDLGDKPFIMACWHGELLMIPYAYKKYRKVPNVKLIISEHFDGSLIAKTLSYFGFGAIRGSSTRSGVKALISSIKELKNGSDLGITPDGPKGPRHEVADGIALMAQKADVQIVLVRIEASSYWQLNSWDKFIVPKPFGLISYHISDMISVNNMDLEEAKLLIKQGLLKDEK